MEKKITTVGVLTSGGDAPGMNAAVRAVVRAAIHSGLDVKGIMRGFTGLIHGEIKKMETTDVADIIERGGTKLFTARCPEMMEEAGQEEAVKQLKYQGIDVLVVIGGDGSFAGAQCISKKGVPVICIPATIDLDIGCTDYAIGFDTAINTAMEAIDKIRDTSTSHERVSIIEVMGRKAGYIALWTGMATGAEDIFVPENYDKNEQALVDRIIEQRRRGKKHHIIINAEGIGDSYGLAQRIEEATGIETRATILGHMQRGGSPSCADRVHATVMGAYAVNLILQGKLNEVVIYKNGEYDSMELDKALKTKKKFPQTIYAVSKTLVR